MKKILSYVRFTTQPTKAKTLYIQELLKDCGIDIETTGKRDKNIVKAITKIQKDNGITPNGVVCAKTYQALIDLRNRELSNKSKEKRS